MTAFEWAGWICTFLALLDGWFWFARYKDAQKEIKQLEVLLGYRKLVVRQLIGKKREEPALAGRPVGRME